MAGLKPCYPQSKQKRVSLDSFCLAETEGFEPSRPLRTLTVQQTVPFNQLGYVSIYYSGLHSCSPLWRRGWDSNPRYARTYANFQDWCLKPTRPPLHIAVTKVNNSIYVNILFTYCQYQIFVSFNFYIVAFIHPLCFFYCLELFF